MSVQKNEQEYSLHEIGYIICKFLPEKLTDYYEKNYADFGMELEEIMKDWTFHNFQIGQADELYSYSTIEKTIMYLLDTELSEFTEMESLYRYKELQRNRKNYMYRVIRQEVGELKTTPNNPCYIMHEWKALNDPIIQKNPEIANLLDGLDYEAFKKKKYSEVTLWKEAPESFLFEFPYFQSLDNKRKAGCILQDIGYSVFSIICKKFYRRKEGFITKTPNLNLSTDTAIVNWQNSISSLKAEYVDEKIVFFETLSAGNGEVRIDHAEIPFTVSPSEKDFERVYREKVKQLSEEFNSGARARTLGPLDFTIYTSILNSMNIAALSGQDLTIKLTDIAADVYGDEIEQKPKSRKRIYVEVMSRIHKMANIRIRQYVQDADGNLKGGGLISFFDYEFIIEDENKPMVDKLQSLTLSEKPGDIDFSSLSAKELETIVIRISPSQFTRNKWQSGVHTRIVSTLYRQISDKGKIILQILQEARMKIYPEKRTRIKIADLKKQIRFNEETRPNRIKKELDREIGEIKKQGMIQSYQIVNGYIELEFMEPDEIEKIAYKIKE